MTVGDLIKQLSALDPSRLVVLSGDAEGNSYQEVRYVDTNAIFFEGSAAPEVVTPALEKQGWTKEDADLGPDSRPCVVMYP